MNTDACRFRSVTKQNILLSAQLFMLFFICITLVFAFASSAHVLRLIRLLLLIAALLCLACIAVTCVQILQTRKLQQLLKQESSQILDPQPITQEKSLCGAFHQILRLRNSVQFSDAMGQYLTRQAELLFLTSQINPHFLYNTLESIRSLALINHDPEAAQMAESLGMMFRYVSKSSGKLVTLRAELNILSKYLLIQMTRFKNRFTVVKAYDEHAPELDRNLMPSLILQPIVENAIVHGMKNTSAGGKIVIAVRYSDEKVIFKISDNGQGMTPEQMDFYNRCFDSAEPPGLLAGAQEQHVGIGLVNINSRIRKEFGNQYGLVLRSIQGAGTEVEVTIPQKIEEAYGV